LEIHALTLKWDTKKQETLLNCFIKVNKDHSNHLRTSVPQVYEFKKRKEKTQTASSNFYAWTTLVEDNMDL
jgi:hypothetical protein